MIMKKRYVILASFLMSLFLISFVSAYFNIRQGSQDVVNFVVDWAEPFLRALLGGDYWNGFYLFEKFLFLILLVAIVYLSLKNIPMFEDKTPILWTVSIVVPLLALRFLDLVWLNTLLLQYKVLGVAMLGLLPFVIYLFFLHNVAQSHTIRKIGWIFFMVIYFFMWMTAETYTYGEVYFWTIIIAFVFLLFDKTIHRYFLRQEMIAAGAVDKWKHIANLKKDIRETRSAMDSGDLPERIANRIIKQKQKRINQYMRLPG